MMNFVGVQIFKSNIQIILHISSFFSTAQMRLLFESAGVIEASTDPNDLIKEM